MIGSFRNRKLRKFYEKGEAKQVGAEIADRVELLLDQLDAATGPRDMNIPGNDFHGLQGKPKRYSVHASGNWCVTFEWDDETNSPIRVDLEDYH